MFATFLISLLFVSFGFCQALRNYFCVLGRQWHTELLIHCLKTEWQSAPAQGFLVLFVQGRTRRAAFSVCKLFNVRERARSARRGPPRSFLPGPSNYEMAFWPRFPL